MLQLHKRNVMHPKSGKSLSERNEKNAQSYLMFLKQKRSGAIKGRGFADGRKQRGTKNKTDTSSPTVSTEAIFLVSTIAAKEDRDVAVMDIPGAFLQTDIEEEGVFIKLQGRMAKLLALIEPSLYRQHIIMEHGKPVLYSELKKGPLRHVTIGFNLLGAGFQRSPQFRLQDQPIRPLCCKQDDRRKTAYYLLAC